MYFWKFSCNLWLPKQRYDEIMRVQFFSVTRCTYVDVAYCYRPSSVVCLSICHSGEPCKNGSTDEDAVWVEDSGGAGNHVSDGGSRSPMGRGSIEGEGVANCKV